MNLFLYSVCTLIWGSTWLVITFQVGDASPITSVFYRFLLGAILLAIYALASKKPMKYDKKDHLLFLGQGICMFSINYMLFYISETMVSSGMTAVAFTSLVYFNMFGMWFFFGKPITKNVVWGSVLGGLGIILLFLNEILKLNSDAKTIWGIVIGATATIGSSLGNMLSQKTYRKGIPVVVTNTYGMFYGSFFTLLIALLFKQNLAIPLTPKFLGALLYLALFGSVIAFGAYLTLSGRIGAEKAAYTSVVSPVIALTLSSIFEGFKWTPYIFSGVVLCLLGNILTLKKKAT
ncbi:MAG TPA: EamA family transporter [Bdellovibrio sp.]|uniref:DMT family transporter n=1 Tax=Bdellovibrio sp. TaxID=28201 RepID=UPI002F1DF8AA